MHDALGPATTPGDQPPSVAVRTSVSLAVLGGAAIAAAVVLPGLEDLEDFAGFGGLLLMGGLTSLLVGASLIFAAPPTRRRLGFWANAIPLALTLLLLLALVSARRH